MTAELILYCTVCRLQIDEKRLARNADTCGRDCARKKRNMRREWRHSKSCPLCGRKARKRSAIITPSPEPSEVSELGANVSNEVSVCLGE